MQGIWRNVAVVVALVLAIAFGWNRLSHDERFPQRNTENPSASGSTRDDVVWSHGRNGAAHNAEEHWQKHGAEFPEFHNAREYEDGALRFVTNPSPGTLTKMNDRGDTLYYQPSTNTFAVKDSSGEPRTFFRPDSGRAYWDRQ